MSTIFLFHGLGGSPEGIWIPWLKDQLERDGHTVIVPAFPHADYPILSEWLNHFRQYESFIDDQTVMIGHSLGGAFSLRLMEKMEQTIHAAFLVASVSGVMGNDLDSLVKTFTEPPYDWKAIRQHCRHFAVIHSDNDPYIPLSQAEKLSSELRTTVQLLQGQGHLSIDVGYTTFPLLLEMIRKEITDG